MPGEVLGVPPVFAVPPPGTMVLGVPPAIGVARPPVVTVLGVGRDSVAPLPPGTMVLGVSTAIGVARPPVGTVLGAVLPPTEPQFMAITAPTTAAPTPPIIRPPLSIVTTVRAVITAVVGPRLERRPPRGVALGATAATANQAESYNAGFAAGSAYALGAIYTNLPGGCVYNPVGTSTYYRCGTAWLSPAYGAKGVYYRVVTAPF